MLSIDLMLASTLDEYSRLLCSPFFTSFHSSRMLQPDGGAQDPDATADDYYCPEGAYYYVTDADDQE